jgi:hypothetical protein
MRWTSRGSSPPCVLLFWPGHSIAFVLQCLWMPLASVRPSRAWKKRCKKWTIPRNLSRPSACNGQWRSVVSFVSSRIWDLLLIRGLKTREWTSSLYTHPWSPTLTPATPLREFPKDERATSLPQKLPIILPSIPPIPVCSSFSRTSRGSIISTTLTLSSNVTQGFEAS